MKNYFAAIFIIVVFSITVMIANYAFAEKGGIPFVEIWDAIESLQEQITALQNTQTPVMKQFVTNETGQVITIYDSEVTSNSIINLSVNEKPGGFGATISRCSNANVIDGSFSLNCSGDVLPAGSKVNYIVINP